MDEITGDDLGAALDVSIPPDARVIPTVRRAVYRWMMRRNLDEGCSLVTFVTSELLAEGVTHALDDLDVHVEEIDGGLVHIEVRGVMSSEPLRFVTVADQAHRRREALLSALCQGHDEVRDDGAVTLWADVRADRGGF